jgi:hypothetical protein
MRPQALLAAAGVIAGLVLFPAGTAFAYFTSTDSSNPARAAAATLAAPAGGAQNGTATPVSVPVKWTAPAGYTPASYTVLRCAGSACTTFTAISAGTCGGTVTGTTCTDTDSALTAGTTYRYEVKAVLGNWVSAPGSPFTASTTAGARLSFATQPASNASIAAAGTGSFTVKVAVQDSNGVTLTNDGSDTVTLAIASGQNPGNGTLSCTGGLTATVSAGVASFTGCAITKAGTGYQLTAASTSNTSLTAPANANSFTIVAGTATQISATAGGGQSATTSASFASPLVATVQDVNGNPVPGISVTFTAPASGASATFATCTSNPAAASCTAATGSSGQATSSAFTANGTAGGYAIAAAASGVTGTASFAETNKAASKVSVVSVTTKNTLLGTAGRLDAGDTIAIKFSGAIDPKTVCSSWGTGSVLATAATVSVDSTGSSNGDDILRFSTAPTIGCGTFSFGTIDLGSGQYYVPPASGTKALSFSLSSIGYDGSSTLTITLGLMTGTGMVNTVPAPGTALTVALSGSILDASDIALTSYSFATSSGVQF